ncbi:alpha/beta hydrolase [Myxosarcina sp. GI1]|uniref:alpha/beta hydrolase n=1 Tax=Myxosarcina sp. GI1 TaxID=1541065 RepID=UPI000567999E|nr:alpha/beta hydrolase [Myxosarcina sp. GI1]
MLKILGTYSSKLIIVTAAIVLGLYGLGCLCLWLFQNRLIFFPVKVISETPKQYGVPYRDLFIPVSDTGEKINGWLFPAPKTEQKSKWLVYFHGNGDNISWNIQKAIKLRDLGFSVLIVDYRGYGFSEGKFPTEKTVYQDAEAAWNYLTEKEQIKPSQILIYGFSLGGAVAIELASKHPDALGLIVESSFTSIVDMTNKTSLPPIFPLKLLVNQHFNSIAKIKSLSMPVLFIHGTEDRVVPYTMSKELFAAASEPKQLVLVPDGGHYDSAFQDHPLYFQSIKNFVRSFD